MIWTPRKSVLPLLTHSTMHLPCSRIIVPSSSKKQKPGAILAQPKKMKVYQLVKMSTASAITKVPSALEPGEKMDYNETKTMYEKFWTECHSTLFLKSS